MKVQSAGPTLKISQVEAGGSRVALDDGVRVVGDDELVAGNQMSTRLVAGGGDGLRDDEGQAFGAPGHGEGPGRLAASALLDIGQSAVGVGGDQGRAVDRGGLHRARLDDGEGVPADASVRIL